jgi:alpha-aminoadipate carrier protein LysW
MPKVKCPECALEFSVSSDVVVGEVVSCPDCGLELEVRELGEEYLSVDVAVVEGEDWGE